MDYNVQVLFLHNLTSLNKEVTIQNYNSFVKNNTDIIGICDEDQNGLDNCFYAPLDSYIPRMGNRWPHPDIPIMNYVLINQNNLIHSHYMICEYDCYTDCNINELCYPYKNYDIVAPHIVYYNKEKDWQWFKNLQNVKNKNLLIGFRPSVFILIKKEALINLALIYYKKWKYINELNAESRLGLISKYAKFTFTEFEDLKVNINWYETKFIKNNKIYHPVKQILNDDLFIDFRVAENSKNIGSWNFGRLGSNNFLGKLNLNKDSCITGYDHFNEKFWTEEGHKIFIYNQKGGLTTLFKQIDDDTYHGDFYNGELFNKSELLKQNAHILVRVKD